MDSFEASVDQKCCSESMLNSRPVVVINRLSAEDIEKYDEEFAQKYIQTSNEDMTQRQQMRHLGLISVKELDTKPLESLSQTFPIRSIARIGPQIRDDFNGLLFNKRLLIKQNFKKVMKRHRKSSELFGTKAKVPSNEEIERNNKLEEKKQILKQIRDQKTDRMRTVTFVAQFEFTSQLFERLVRTLDLHFLSPSEVMKASVRQISLPSYDIRPKNAIKYNNWSASNVERRSMKSELSFKLKGNAHKYVFTRRQRLEKIQRMKCCLNWKSRLLRLNCNELFVNLVKINKCLVCFEPIDGKHSCKESDPPNEVEPKSESRLFNDSDSYENTKPSLDLTELIISSNVSDIEDRDLENNCKEIINKSLEIEVKPEVKVVEKPKDSMKRAFLEIDVNLTPKPGPKRRSSRLKCMPL